MRVAFCGLGHMGRAMAANLASAGHEVLAWNRTPGKTPPGARECGSVQEAASGAEVAITMLADDAAVEAVARDLLAALPSGAVHCGMSTISIQLCRKLARDHAQRGQRFVASPVFGRPDAAAARKLWIIPAGQFESVQRCQPLFDALGQGTFPMGETPEHASLTKLCGNFMIASLSEMLAEAFALAEKGGIDPARLSEPLVKILFAGAPIPSGYASRIAATQFEPAGFAMALGLKDITLALRAGEELKAPLPIASLLRDRFIASLANGREGWDWGGIAAVAREAAGLPARRG